MLRGGGAAGDHERQSIPTETVHQQLCQLAVSVRDVHGGHVGTLHVCQR